MADLINILEAELDQQSGTPPADPPPKAPPEEEEEEEEIVEDSEADDQDESDAEESEDELSEDDESENDPEADPEPRTITPPSGMTAEDEKQFASLTPEMKMFMVQREADRNAHFTRQSDEVATQRKAAETAAGQYQSQLTELSQQLQAIVQEEIAPPDAELRETDPIKYDTDMAIYVQTAHQQQKAQQELTKLQQQRSNELVQLAAQEAVKAKGLIPDLADPEKGPTLETSISQYAQRNGYTAGEVGAAGARDVQMLYKAMLYDNMKSKGKTVAKKVAAKGKAPKSIKGAASKAGGAPTRDTFQKLKKQVRKSGSDKDMSKMFEHMLENE